MDHDKLPPLDQIPQLFDRRASSHPDYQIVLGGIIIACGLGLLSSIFPFIQFVLAVMGGGLALLVICIGIGKYLKYRRLEHEAYYGEITPEEKSRRHGKTQ